MQMTLALEEGEEVRKGSILNRINNQNQKPEANANIATTPNIKSTNLPQTLSTNRIIIEPLDYGF